MKTKKITLGLAMIVAGALSSSAQAATWYVQPASGYVWNNGAMNGLAKIDGRVQANGNSGNDVIWITPVSINSTNRNYTGTQRTTNAVGGQVLSRLVAFDRDGLVTAAGTPVATDAIGTVLVPSQGSVFAQSQFKTGCAGFCSSAILDSMKFVY